MTFTAQGDTTAFMLPGDAPTQCPRAGEATQMFSSPGAGVGERPFSVGAGCERPWLGLFVSRSVKALLMPQDRGAGGPEVQATPRHRSSVSRPSTASTCTASSSLGVATPETRASRGPEPEPVSSGGEVPGSLRTCGTVLGEPPREEPTKTRGGEAEAEAAAGEAPSATRNAVAGEQPGGERGNGDAGALLPSMERGVARRLSERCSSCRWLGHSDWKGQAWPRLGHEVELLADRGATCGSDRCLSALSAERLRQGVGKPRSTWPAHC